MELIDHNFYDPALVTRDLSAAPPPLVMFKQVYPSQLFPVWPKRVAAALGTIANILFPYEIVSDKTIL